MAFIDAMKGRFSQVGQDTVKMARDISETARLNNEISAAENQINALYREVGYTIYCSYRNDPLPDVAELIEQINVLHSKIESNQIQISTINAASHCPNCNAKIKPGMSFCSSCGAKLQFNEIAAEVPEDKPLFCPNCGSPLSADAAFCTSCGCKIT